jgi:methionine-S-sulfoxide reductase
MTPHTAIVAAGCFWGVEEMLRQLPGITATQVGYTGGTTENPTYEQICTGTTGHAEAIKITFDPSKLSYERVLELFFSLHDPTQFNRQGNDLGSQYRSAIFVSSDEERASAELMKTRENDSGRWPRPVVTSIEALKHFYPAELYHQEYLRKNPGGYNCHYWHHGAPKVGPG